MTREGDRCEGKSTASEPATARKSPSETIVVARSRIARRLSRLARCSSITRWASGSSAREVVPAAVATGAKSADQSLGLTSARARNPRSRDEEGLRVPLVGDAAQGASAKVRCGGNKFEEEDLLWHRGFAGLSVS